MGGGDHGSAVAAALRASSARPKIVMLQKAVDAFPRRASPIADHFRDAIAAARVAAACIFFNHFSLSARLWRAAMRPASRKPRGRKCRLGRSGAGVPTAARRAHDLWDPRPRRARKPARPGSGPISDVFLAGALFFRRLFAAAAERLRGRPLDGACQRPYCSRPTPRRPSVGTARRRSRGFRARAAVRRQRSAGRFPPGAAYPETIV